MGALIEALTRQPFCWILGVWVGAWQQATQQTVDFLRASGINKLRPLGRSTKSLLVSNRALFIVFVCCLFCLLFFIVFVLFFVCFFWFIFWGVVNLVCFLFVFFHNFNYFQFSNE